ncbi:MAG: GNAT family N-acetyltransferase [Reichenbachiella sp.]|uniref:GNAT family N-acetyltransferase n=1 Tax=Reichenbachiella sp. TaxID=2184521 RepID=UPI0032675E93
MNKSTTLNRGFLFKIQKAASSLEAFTGTLLNVFSKGAGQYKLRKIKSTDDEKVKELIQKILLERGGLGIESLYYDSELISLTEHYQKEKNRFNVLTLHGEIVGTVGIGSTAKSDTCEIKKLYLHKDCRSKGLGKVLFTQALKQAFLLGYQSCVVSIELRNEAFHSFLIKNGFKELLHTSNNPYEIQLHRSLN